MRVNVVSDLHLECGYLELPGGDVLVLAGDAFELATAQRDPAQFKLIQHFLTFELQKYRHVVYVMGNHEHYGSVKEQAQASVQALLPRNVHLLENQSVQINGVLFVGATLWTNLGNSDPIASWHVQRVMTDYRKIKVAQRDLVTGSEVGIRNLMPDDTVHWHQASAQFFAQELARGLPTVLVSHHAPSVRSIDDHYMQTPGDRLTNLAYYTDMSELMLDNPNALYWCHGHVHRNFDYTIGATRVLCNPRGYAGYESMSSGFDATVGFDVGT